MAKKQAEQVDTLALLKQDIKTKQLRRLYFFHGEESFLLHHYFNQMKKLLVDELTEAFNYHRLNSENFEIRSFAECVENLPMMAESTFVWVDEIDPYKMPEADREKMTEIFSDIPEYCTVVFTYNTTPWKPDARLKKLHQAIADNGLVVEFAKQEQRDLIPWIARHFAANGKRISNQLCAYLIEITGGTMTALAGEISKISAYSGAEEIKKSDIDAVTEPVLDALVFRMADMLTGGEPGGALVQLQTLLKMQQEPVMILGAIGSHFRKLSAARILLNNGKSPNELMRLYRMSEYPARKAMSTAGKLSDRFHKKASELILEADRQLKTSYDDPDRVLEMLVLQLAQEVRNG